MSHWYRRDGRPCYQVVGKTTGKPRSPDIRDARGGGLQWPDGPHDPEPFGPYEIFPSVTTVLGAMGEPWSLVQWKKEQAIRAAWAFGTPDFDCDPAEYMKAVMDEADRESREAREFGTDLHAPACLLLENPDAAIAPELEPYLVGWRKWIAENVERVLETERSLCNGLWAGKRDCKLLLRDGRKALADWKSKRDAKKPPHWEWAEQLAGYEGLDAEPVDAWINGIIPTREGVGGFVAHEWPAADMESARRCWALKWDYYCESADWRPER